MRIDSEKLPIGGLLDGAKGMTKGDIEKHSICKREGMNSRMAEPNDSETHKKVFLKFDSRRYSFFDLPTPDLGYGKKGLRLEWSISADGRVFAGCAGNMRGHRNFF